MSFPSAIQMASDIDMLTFTLLMQLGMAIAIAQHKKFHIVRSPHIYVELGTGSLACQSLPVRGWRARLGDGMPNFIYIAMGTPLI